jgi:acyl transferase domain-containing protein
MASNSGAIAIIGVGCRFPGGANSPERLWKILSQGRNTWSEVPEERFNWRSFYHADPQKAGMHNHRGGHFLDDNIAAFDGRFFGITPQECEAIDPQYRIQLEVTYEAFENAGIPLKNLRGSDTAVYVATFGNDYTGIQYKDLDNISKYHLTGTGSAMASNQISYFFDLRGPSITLDTGCSGSMVAIHQACQSLRTGESRMAVAGGVSLIITPDMMVPMSMFGFVTFS